MVLSWFRKRSTRRGRSVGAKPARRAFRFKPVAEMLEDRTLLSAFYDFKLVAQSGSQLSKIEDYVSVNNSLQVAMVAHDASGSSAVYVQEGNLSPTLVSFPPSDPNAPGRDYGRAASISNPSDGVSSWVAAPDQVPSSTAAYVRRWPTAAPASSRIDVAATPSAIPFDPSGDPEHFDSFTSFTDINRDNQVVFVGLDTRSSTTQDLRVRNSLASGIAGQTIDIGDFPATAGLRPQISDDAEVVFRSPSASSIFKTGPGSPIYKRIAGGPEGFVADGDLPAVGRSPGISEDGKAVVFFGNHPSDLVPGYGPGIFASILKPGGNPDGGSDQRIFVRLAGIPGELGFDTSGKPLTLLDYATFSTVSNANTTDSRVGVGGKVDYHPGKTSELYVTFLANDPRDGLETLWQVRLDVTENVDKTLSFIVKSPQQVAKVGETILGKTLTDLEIYHPVTQTGNIAFWAALQGGGQAVFLGTTSPDTTHDGLPDFWKTNGIDINEDGVTDLNLAAEGATAGQRDVFLELDWLDGHRPSSSALDDLRQAFANAPAPKDVAGHDTGVPPGINLHIDSTYSRSIQDTTDYDIVYMGLPTLTIPAGLDLTAKSLQEIKQENFGPDPGVAKDAWLRDARLYVYHYGVIANFISTIHVDVAGEVVYDDRARPDANNGNIVYPDPSDPSGPSGTTTPYLQVIDGVVAASHVIPQQQRANVTFNSAWFVADHSLAGHSVKVVAGPGHGQILNIVDNTPYRLFLDRDWNQLPDASSKFVLLAGNSGLSEIGGNDFIISLGSLGSYQNTDVALSQTLVHEIGHNFGFIGDVKTGLDDAGNLIDFTNFHSVMNYDYQIGNYNKYDPSTNPSGYITDYSHTSQVVWVGDRKETIDRPEWDSLRLDFNSFGRSFGNSYGVGGLGSAQSAADGGDLTPAQARQIAHPADPLPPLLQISAPAQGTSAAVGSGLTVDVVASDNVGIGQVMVGLDLNGDGDTDDLGETVFAQPQGGNLYRAAFASLAGPSDSRRIVVQVVDTSGNVTTDDRTITVTGGGTNHPPSAQADVITTVPGTGVTIPVLVNDSDLDGNPRSLVSAASPSHGTAVGNANGTVTYTPTAGFTGDDTFAYVIQDDQGSSDTGTVIVHVRAVNGTPVLDPIANQVATAGTAVNFTAHATDPGHILTYSLDPGAPTGASIDPTTGAFTWTPTVTDATQVHNIVVRVTDDSSPPATATQLVVVNVLSSLQVVGVTRLTLPSPGPMQVAVDFNEALDPASAQNVALYHLASDGLPDLPIQSAIYSDNGTQHRVVLTVPAGTPVPPENYHVTIDGANLVAANGDRAAPKLDMIWASTPDTNSIQAFAVQANGSIAPTGESFSFGDGPPIQISISTDYTGDGISDMIALCGPRFARRLMLHRGIGDGTYAAPQLIESDSLDTFYGTSGDLTAFTQTDWNGDHIPDLVVPAGPNYLARFQQLLSHFDLSPRLFRGFSWGRACGAKT
jgi:hypothetical protein